MSDDVLSFGLSRKNAWLGSLIVFLLALILRLGGIGWGLPAETRHQSLHPDELLIKEWTDRSPYFKPGFYNYGTLYLTALKVGSDMGRSYGWVQSGQGVPQWETDRDIHLTGRIITAVAGAVTCSLAFAALLCITGVLGASLGGLALLIAPGHVVHSRFQTSDVLATMLIALAMFFAMRIATSEDSRKNNAFACAASIGLAAGTKYSGVLFVIPLLFLLFWRGERKRILPSLGVLALAFLVATPGVVLEPGLSWAGFTYELAHTGAGHGIVFANTANGFLYHLDNLKEAFGLAPFVVGFSGLLWAVVTKQKWALALAAFCVAYYFVIGRAEVKFLRYVLPLLPMLAVGLGYAVGESHRRGSWFRAVPALAVLFLGVSLASPYGAWQLTEFMRSTDPRDQAAVWIEKNAPTATVGFVSDPWFYSPPLFPDTSLLSPNARLAAMQENPRVLRYISADGSRRDWDLRLITESQPDYIIFSSFEFLDNDRINQPDFIAFVDQLVKAYKPCALFWGPTPLIATKQEADKPITREMIRSLFTSRYPLTHDMMYIQPTLCLFVKRTLK